MNLVIGPLAPVIQQGVADVLAVPVSVNDEDGPNDEPGQKDLTKLTIDYAGLPTSVFVSWNWDEISWSGSNTGDACALFDTNDNLNVDAAVCVTVSGDPATLLDVRLYECTADAKVDRCTGPSEIADPALTDCTVAQSNDDPFPAGAEFPTDTKATCTIFLDEVAATAAELVNVCSYPSQEPNSDPSDCVLIIRDGAIRVDKVVVNDNGGTATCPSFSFDIAPGAISESFEADCSNLIAVAPGTYSVTEDAAAGYATTYANNLNANANCNSLAVGSGDTVVCTITNNDIGATLTVTKVVTNDDGGTKGCADFTFQVNGGAATAFEADCTNVLSVNAGNYSVTEPAVSGYATTYANSLNGNANCTSLAIGLGGNATCTITNNDQQGTLTVTKVVVNDDGGTLGCSDFSFQINGGAATAFEADCTNAISVDAGNYSVTEPPVSGYATTYANSANANPNCTNLAVGLAGSATCTVTNDDEPGSLTVTKVVINDDGGTKDCEDFTFQVNGGAATAFEADCTNVIEVDAGSYSVTEPAVGGYATTYANSLNANANCTSLAIGLDGSATCTITNNDQPGTLTVTKVVSGGDLDCDDFTFQVNGGAATAFEADCTNVITVDAGTYSVTEPAVDGYTTTYANSLNANANCTSLAIANNGSATCTITNTRDTGDLTVIKDLDPNDDPGLFNLLIDGNIEFADASDGDSTGAVTLDTGTYTFGETAGTGTDLDDYQTSVICLDGATPVDATPGVGTNWSVDVTKDSDIVCTITNERETGDLTVIKDLVPNDDPGLFNLQIDEETELADASDGDSTGAVTVNTGSHSVGETAGTGTLLSNYASSIECLADGGEGEIVASGSGAGPLLVDVGFGDDIVCTITNTRVTVGFDKANDLGDNATVEPGETIHYELTVTVNAGMATNVVVTDEIPAGLTYVAGSANPSTGFSIVGQDLTWDVGTLAEGVYKFQYDATVDADASGSLKNLGCVDADQNDELVCDETTVLVQNIVVTKENGTSGAVVPGTVVDFTLALDVTNGPIDDVTIVDQLPAGIGNASDISDGGIYDSTANTITWTLTNVLDNETLTYKATVTATAAGAQTNVATITEGPCVGDGCDDDSTVTVRIPTLVIDKVASTETITISGPANALVATPSVVTWTLSYTLTSGPVTGVVITDVVPVGFTFLDAANGGTFAAGTVTWNLGTVTSSGSVSFRTTVNPATISRTAPTVNTAIIDSNETAPDNGQDSVTVTVIPPPLGGTPTPLPNTATGIGVNGAPVNVPVELLVAFFIGSLGALALANVRASSRRR